MNCALGTSKSIRFSRDFVIAELVIAGFISTYFTVILLGFQMLFVIAGCHCLGYHVNHSTQALLLVFTVTQRKNKIKTTE